jgi:hypothetical protein
MRTTSLTLAFLLAGCLGGANGPGSNGGGTNGSNGSLQSCPTSPAPAIFTNALCLCRDFVDVGYLEVGASAAPGNPSVGVNGVTRFANGARIAGGWAAFGGAEDAGDSRIGGNFVTPQGLTVAANFEVAKDLSVGGTLSGAGRLAVGGALRVGGADQLIGFEQVASSGAYAAPAGPPCPCDPSQLLDVAGKVAAAKSTNNNGALASIGVTDLHLPTGSYYFTDLDVIGLTRLHIDGAVALYIDGDLDAVGADRIALAPGATLDLYVSGAVRTVGWLGAGDPSNPSAFRVYIGGAHDLTLSVGAQTFAGSIYAPLSTIAYVGDTRIEGGLFAKQLYGVGVLRIDAAQPSAPPPSTCAPAPSTSAGSPAGDAATAPIQ